MPDNEMGTKDGKTEFARDTVVISVKKSVHENAVFGDGRARMTLAHELAHGVLHYGLVNYRATNAAGSTDLARVNASESAEHQAKVFAAAFLIHDEIAAQLETAEAISVEFGVSLWAAEICFSRLMKTSDRNQSAERVLKMRDEAVAKLLGKKPAEKPGYLSDPCTACQRPTLIPIGTKVLCDTCGFAGDRFQDGDTG